VVICESLGFAGCVLESMLTRERYPELERRVGNMTNYPVGDFLIQVKNNAMAGKREFSCKASKLVEAVAKVLKKEGYLEEVKKKDGRLNVRLSYRRKLPVLLELKLVSKPELRVYTDVRQLESRRGISVLILSTPSGIMTSREAIKKRVGGEVIAEVI